MVSSFTHVVGVIVEGLLTQIHANFIMVARFFLLFGSIVSQTVSMEGDCG